MYCKFCGEQIDADAKFCPHCGSAIEGSTQKYSYNSQGDDEFSSKSNDYFAPFVGNSQAGKINKVTYILFAILLGGFGVHKFYEGKTGMGVLYVLFCWTGIPAIIGLVEGIMAAGKPADKYGNFVDWN